MLVAAAHAAEFDEALMAALEIWPAVEVEMLVATAHAVESDEASFDLRRVNLIPN